MKLSRMTVAMMLCLALLAVCAAAETTDMQLYRLGTSGYTIEIPASFVEDVLTEDDIADDMVAYMSSPDTLMDFDVYMFSKEGYPDTIAEYTAEEAAEYDAFEIVTDGNVNGIEAGWYRAKESYEDEEFDTLTYVLMDGEDYVEISFWLDGETAEAEVEAIMNTLAYGE